MDLSNTPVEELTYEQALQELEEVVSMLETDEQALEDAIRLFERGQQLAAHCTDLLENAELRVRTISSPLRPAPNQ